MSHSFNLIYKSWIPCLTIEGKRMEFGLHDTLVHAHQLREVFCDSPLETAALYRLLLAVMIWVFHPDDEKWAELWRKRREGLDAAVFIEQWAVWQHRFDLFHETHPFFQVADESQLGKRAAVNKMIPQLTPSDTLFDHRISDPVTGVSLSAAEATRALITNQYYGIGYNQFVDAPCAKGVMFLIQGDTLVETLLLNLPYYPEENGPYHSLPDDLPAWAQANVFKFPIAGEWVSRDATPTVKNGRTALKYKTYFPMGQLDYLTWHNRKTKLIVTGPPDKPEVRQISWAPGMRLHDEVTDPMQYYRMGKNGWRTYSLRRERAIWRDLTTLLSHSVSLEEVRPIAAIPRLAYLSMRFPELHGAVYSLTAFAMIKDKGAISLIRQERTPLPTALLHDDHDQLIGHLSHALRTAEQSATTVRRASFTLAWLLLDPGVTLPKSQNSRQITEVIDDKYRKGAGENSHDQTAKRAYTLQTSWGLERIYWSSLETHFHRFIQDLPQTPDEAILTWHEEVQRAAHDAFRIAQAYVGGDLRAIRAAAIAHQVFFLGLSRIFGKRTNATNAPGEVEHEELEVAYELDGMEGELDSIAEVLHEEESE